MMRHGKQLIGRPVDEGQAVLSRLCQILRKNGSKLLQGEGKLSFTTQSIILLVTALRRLDDVEDASVSTSPSQLGQEGRRTAWMRDIEFLREFVSKTIALKITHGLHTMQGPVQIQSFSSLRVLDVKKVPVHMLEGLQALRGQLQAISLSRGLNSLQDLFESCGGDMSSPMSWPVLHFADLSFNNLTCLDGSLRLLSSLEEFDVSHNQLERTDKNLEYLTEVKRLNLGFNCLDSLPTFSISCQAKMTTLIMKNNNLDSIDGIGELMALEELDVSENCIVDHVRLAPLTNLSMLNRLSVQGNPMYYHKDHRSLVVASLAWQAVTTKFELDGRRLSTSELCCAKRQSNVSISRRPSSIAHSVITHAERVQSQADSAGNISDEYSFLGSDTIAASLPVRSRKKKGRKLNKRGHGIADADSSISEMSSPEGSLASSPVVGRNLADHVQTRHEVERLRNHYGSNWLQVMDVHFGTDLGSGGKTTDMTSHSATTPCTTEQQPSTVTNGMLENAPTDDDLYLNEPVQLSESPKSTMTSREVIDGDRGQDATDVAQVNQNGSYVLPESSGFEWTKTDDEEIESYGEESEPFIVLLKQRDCEQLLVTLNQRYIVEKDLNGMVVERLDMRSLLTLERSALYVQHPDIVDDVLMPHLKLTFDYVKKDRRERVYVMENQESAMRMCDTLELFLAEKELKAKPKFINQCLKCSYMFSKEEGRAAASVQQIPTSGTMASLKPQLSVIYQCPKCGSDHVIEIEKTSTQSTEKTSTQSTEKIAQSTEVEKTSTQSTEKRAQSTEVEKTSAQSTPVGSYTAASDLTLSPLRSPRSQAENFASSPLAKSTPQKVQPARQVQVCKKLYQTEGNGNRLHGDSSTLGNCDIPPPGSVHVDAESGTSRRDSWPLGNRPLVDRVSRLSSQDSDITILTNPSDGSIAVISESSSETLSPSTPVDDRIHVFNNTSGTTSARTIVTSTSEPNQLSLSLDGVDKGEITPMGSPLTNSVCVSMVTSVYQNSGLTEEEDKSNPEYHDKVYDVSSTSGCPSIYDGSGSSRVPADARTDLTDVSRSLSDSETIGVHVSEAVSNTEIFDDVTSVDGVKETMQASHSTYEHLFTTIDHQLKLHFMMTYFDDLEEFESILKCDTCQYLVDEEYHCYLVITSTKFYVFKVASDQSSVNVSDWLSVVDIQPITELHHIDIGLGCQSFRLEFDTECSCYTFIIRDAEKCTNFVNSLAELLHKSEVESNKNIKADFHHSPPESTILAMQNQVLNRKSETEQQLVLYIMGYIVRGHNRRYPASFLLTTENLCLVKENHQWPQPRLQAPLDTTSVAKHFTVLERQPINNIATVEIFETDKRKLRLSFFNEQTGLETQWNISMETTSGIQELINGIRNPWEDEFGVELDVTIIPFSDVEGED